MRAVLAGNGHSNVPAHFCYLCDTIAARGRANVASGARHTSADLSLLLRQHSSVTEALSEALSTALHSLVVRPAARERKWLRSHQCWAARATK